MIEDNLIDAARRAAPAFGLEPISISILNRSENVVCALTMADGHKAAMRLHRPGYNTTAELRSEVLWVAALADAGVPVPAAVPARAGGHYSPIQIQMGDALVEHQVGVVEWVEGKPLGGPLAAGDHDLSAHYERIGEIAAQIRCQSESWVPPTDFVRRRWDTTSFVGDQPLWGRFWEAPALDQDQRDLLSQARLKLTEELARQSTAADRFGLIHADLHLGNVMAEGHDITIIDFDDAGFGWYAYELAVSLTNVAHEPWFERARTAMFAGYRRFHSFDDDEVQLVDTLLVMRSLMTVGWLTDRPELPAYEHLSDVIAEAVEAAETYLD